MFSVLPAVGLFVWGCIRVLVSNMFARFGCLILCRLYGCFGELKETTQITAIGTLPNRTFYEQFNGCAHVL